MYLTKDLYPEYIKKILNTIIRQPNFILFYLFVYLFWLHHTACEILIPQPRVKPIPPAVEVQSLNHSTTTKVPTQFF